MLVVGNLVIFEDFVFGRYLLLFSDLGSDSVVHNLPVMYYFSSLHPFGQFWIHASALGNNVFMFPWVNAFNPLLKALGWNTTVAEFAHRIVYYPVLQSLLAGVFFYWFLLRSGRSTFAAIAAASSYALCGAYTAVSTWMVMVTPPLLAGLAIVLWARTVWQQEGRWYLFALAIAYFAVSTQPLVTIYQLAVFLLLYLSYDAVSHGEPRARRALSAFFLDVAKTACVGAVGLLAVAFFLLPHFWYTVFQTARPAVATVRLLARPELAGVLTVFLRLYSNDLLGTANVWTARFAYHNYMELPFLYCGLLLILVLPAHLLVSDQRTRFRRERLALAGLLLPLALSQLLPGVRAYLFFAGKGLYFRWTNVFFVAGLAVAGSRALDALALGRLAGKPWLVVVFTAAALLFGLLPLSQLTAVSGPGVPFDPLVCSAVAVAILGYTLLLHARRQALRHYGILLLLLAELTFQGHHTVSSGRRPLTEVDAGRGGTSRLYSNGSVLEAISLVKGMERGSFFRLSKTPEYGDVLDNSSLCQGYRGTRGYTTFNNPATVAFFDDRHLWSQHGPVNSWLPGFQERYLLDTLVGVKYYIRHRSLPIPPWAVYLTSVGRVEVFRNPRVLPLGVLYDQYMLEPDFRALRLSEEQKDRLMLSVVVLDRGALQRRISGLEALTHLTGSIPVATDDAGVRAVVQEKQSSGLEVVSLQNDSITGKIVADRPSLAFFSIPYDVGWHIRVDGTEVQTLRVQIGFLGAFLSPGAHAIRLEYRPPYYRLGLALAAATVIGMTVVLAFFRRESARFLSIAWRRADSAGR